MSTGTTLSRLSGFLRMAVMAAVLGININRLADAYNVANTTPNIIYELALGGVLSAAFLPVFVDWMQTNGKDAAWDVANRVMTLTALLLSLLALIGIVVAPWIINLYWPKYQGTPSGELATFFLRWFMPQIIFYGLGAVASGLLQANRRFAAPMFAPILNNLVVIATFITFALMPGPNPASPTTITTAQKTVLGLGTTLGIVVMTAALWPSLRRIGYRWRPNFGFRHEAVTRIARLAKWTVVYVAVNQLGYLSVIRLAGSNTGVLTAYTYAFIFFSLPHAIFAVSIFTALLPSMSGSWAAGDKDRYRSLLSEGIRTTACIVIPASLGYVALALPIIRLLLEYGNNTPSGSQLTASILAVMALGLFPFSLFQLILRAFYAMQDSRTPALINIAAVTVNVLVDLLFFFVLDLGVPVSALGHAVSYWFASTVLLLLIRRRIGPIGDEDPRLARADPRGRGSRRRRWPGSSPRGSNGAGTRRSRRRRRRCSARWWRGSPCSSRPRPRSGSRRSAGAPADRRAMAMRAPSSVPRRPRAGRQDPARVAARCRRSSSSARSTRADPPGTLEGRRPGEGRLGLGGGGARGRAATRSRRSSRRSYTIADADEPVRLKSIDVGPREVTVVLVRPPRHAGRRADPVPGRPRRG